MSHSCWCCWGSYQHMVRLWVLLGLLTAHGTTMGVAEAPTGNGTTVWVAEAPTGTWYHCGCCWGSYWHMVLLWLLLRLLLTHGATVGAAEALTVTWYHCGCYWGSHCDMVPLWVLLRLPLSHGTTVGVVKAPTGTWYHCGSFGGFHWHMVPLWVLLRPPLLLSLLLITSPRQCGFNCPFIHAQDICWHSSPQLGYRLHVNYGFDRITLFIYCIYDCISVAANEASDCIMWLSCRLNSLTHWGRDKMPAIYWTTLLNAFSWMKISIFWLTLLPRVQFAISHNWFR